MYPNGYNLTIGGEGHSKIDHSRIVALWGDGKSLREIASIMGIHISTVGKHLREVPSYSKKRRPTVQGTGIFRKRVCARALINILGMGNL